MKKRFIASIVFLFCAGYAFSQNDCQTYVNQAKNAKSTTEKDRLFRKAAECGDEDVQFYIGTLYYDVAEGLRKDYSNSKDDVEKWLIEEDIKSNGKDAIKYLSMAAETGHPGAQAYLCLIYYEGHFVEENFDKSKEWARKVNNNSRSTSKEKEAVNQVLGRIEMLDALEWW